MSEVNATGAIGHARTTEAASQTTTTTKAKSSGTEIADAMRSNDNKKAPTLPQRPKPRVITVTVPSGSSLGFLAEEHHTTVSEILKLNPNIKNPNQVSEGQKIKINHIDKKDWDAYQKDLNAYNSYQYKLAEQEWEAEQAQKLQNKINKATASIQQAKEMGYGDYYNFQIDKKTGDVTITLKVDKELGDIRNGLGLPRGHLRAKNPKIMDKYKPGRIYDIDNGVRINDWDDIDVKAGEKFVISGDCINPKTGFFGGRY